MYKLLVLLFSSGIFAASHSFILTEENLILSDSPILKLYQVDEINSLINLREFEGKFNPNVDVSLYHKIDNQRPLSSSGYDRATSPINTRELSINKPFMFGGSAKFKLYQSKISNAFIAEATTSGAGLEIAIDLVKGLWKQTTLNSYRLQKETLKFQKSITSYKTYLFKNNLRKLYWNLIANDLSLKVLNRMLKNSKKTLSIIEKRYKASIADRGDLSRMKAQVKSTEAFIISYNYQKEQLLKKLRSILTDDYKNKNISLGDYNINNTIKEITSCTQLIVLSGLKYKNSLLQNQSIYLKEINNLKQQIDNTYGDIDVKLISTYDKIGKARGFSNSLTNLAKDAKEAYSVGITVSIPIGDRVTKNLKIKRNRVNSNSLIRKNLIKMTSFYKQTVKMISLLNQVIKNQVAQNKLLGISIKNSRRKYKQARLTIEQLVLEENNLLQSDLDIIQTKLNVVLTLLDYFSVFNKTNCKFNKITKF